MSQPCDKPDNNLYLLAFIDVVDRLDILLLEIRHLQQSIIYSLRAPTLYLPLRYEEKYIFGESWDEENSQGAGIQYDIALVKEWIIRYPTPNTAVRTYRQEQEKQKGEKLSAREEIKHRIRKRIGRIWIGDNWARDQRLQYHALYALQLLKQRVLRDKIALYRASLQANLANTREHHNKLDKPAFLILRQGVIHQADRYVAILKNHKQQVSQALDFGMPSDPHPSTERRREMGIFMDFLSNRTQDIQRDILHLLSSYNQNDSTIDSKNSVLMFHGWSQETRVSNTHLFDKTNYHYNKYGLGKKSNNKKKNKHKRHVGYINTSFWAPDRPDLHPIIAHEIAESVIKNTLGGLDDVALSNCTDSFTELLIFLKKQLLKHATDSTNFASLKEDSSHYIQQIAADLLAGTVKGVSYLYSLFLLRIASDSHRQLEVGSFIRLDMVYSLKAGTASFDEALQWYIRLHLTAFWIENIVHVSLSPLDKSIVEGCIKIADDVLAFLDNNAPAIRTPRAAHWKALVTDLKDVILNSQASKDSKIWRHKRSIDDWKDERPKSTRCEGKKHYARSTKRLNIRLQNYLFRELFSQKRKVNKPLFDVPSEEFESKFNAIYPLKISKSCIPHVKHHSYRHPKELFRHMYDIPYQSSFLRSVDILMERPPSQLFFQQLRWDMELGRGLFALALEFYSRETESPEHRLSLCINQITYLHCSMQDSSLKDKLAGWLTGDGTLLIAEDKIGKGDEFTQSYVNKILKKIDDTGANIINATFASYKPIDSRIIRRLEEIAGNKLCILLKILRGNINSVINQPCHAALNSLEQFLSIREYENKAVKGTPKTFFYNHMLAALGDISAEDKDTYEQKGTLKKRFLPKAAPSVMIDRLSITNIYPVPDPMHLEENTNPSKNENGLEFSEALKKDKWQVFYKNNEDKNKHIKNTWITMGRFDGISMAEVRLPCKCYLQSFGDGLSLPYEDKQVKDQLNEGFSPHFSRREIARPVTIIDDPSEKGSVMQSMYKDLFAMIGVTLQRRSMRLDFLFRMIRALTTNTHPTGIAGIEKSICDLRERGLFVIAYLTDGWGDMLFTFRKKTSLKEGDLNSIFTFQQAVYEDFMVDRTEILFTPQCLDYALGRPKKYRITVQTRMMEDRWLEAGIENYTDKLCKLCEKLPTDIISNVDITLTPGRNDFSFVFTGVESTPEGSYQQLIEWLEGNLTSTEKREQDKYNAMTMLGHLETYIERLLILNNGKVMGKDR